MLLRRHGRVDPAGRGGFFGWAAAGFGRGFGGAFGDAGGRFAAFDGWLGGGGGSGGSGDGRWRLLLGGEGGGVLLSFRRGWEGVVGGLLVRLDWWRGRRSFGGGLL